MVNYPTTNQWMKNPYNHKTICDYKGNSTCHMQFFATSFLLPLVQGDYMIYSCMCPLQLNFFLLQLKL